MGLNKIQKLIHFSKSAQLKHWHRLKIMEIVHSAYLWSSICLWWWQQTLQFVMLLPPCNTFYCHFHCRRAFEYATASNWRQFRSITLYNIPNSNINNPHSHSHSHTKTGEHFTKIIKHTRIPHNDLVLLLWRVLNGIHTQPTLIFSTSKLNKTHTTSSIIHV